MVLSQRLLGLGLLLLGSSALLPPAAAPHRRSSRARDGAGSELLRLSTDAGAIEIELLSEEAPRTTRLVRRLVKGGIYDGCVLYRAEEGFVLQVPTNLLAVCCP